MMKANYSHWGQKSLALVFCDFYLNTKIMAPHSHRHREGEQSWSQMKETLRKKCHVLDGSRALQELELDPALVNDASGNVEGEPGSLTGMETGTSLPKQNAGLSLC